MKITSLKRMCAVMLCASAPLAATAAMQDSKLALAIPDDVHVLVHAHEIPEDDFVQESMTRVLDSVKQTGVIDDLTELFFSGAIQDPAQREAVEARIAEVKAVVDKIEWSELVSDEFLYAMRMPEGAGLLQGPPDSLWVLSGDAETAPQNFAGIRELFDYAAGMQPGVFTITTEESTADELFSVAIAGNRMFFAAREEGTILLSMGTGLLDDALASLAGTSTKSPMVGSDAFATAFKELPEPGFVYSYVRVADMVDAVGSAVFTAMDAQGPDAQPPVRPALDFAFAELKNIQVVASSGRFEGERKIQDSLTTLAPGYDKGLMGLVFPPSTGVPKSWATHIPATATGFSVQSGVDPLAAWNQVRETIKTVTPNGEQSLAMMDAEMAKGGFSVENDLLSWLTFDAISFQTPAVFPAGPGQVMMLRVKDAEKARAALDSAFAKLDAMMREQGKPGLTRLPVASLGEEFQIVTHPSMAMFLRPVVGVRDGYLYISTTDAAIKTSLQVAAGEVDNILANPRFGAHAVDAGEGVTSVTFRDLSNTGNELAQALGMMGFAGMFVQGQPDVPPQVGQAFTVIQKLAPAMGQIDFLDSSTSVTTVGDNVVRSTTTTAYIRREATATPESQPAADGEGEGETRTRTRPKVR